MDIQEWQRVYDILERIHSGYYQDYINFKSGSNQKIRKEGERKATSAIQLAKMHIEKNPELLHLAFAKESPFFMDEFYELRYFDKEMQTLLEKIREKIASLK